MRNRIWAAALSAAVLAVGVGTSTAGVAAAAPPKPTPHPFSITDLATVYESDVHGNEVLYFNIVEPFNGVRANHPATMAANLDKVVAVNQRAAADPALSKRAVADDGEDLLITMSDGFGQRLGKLFRDALAAQRLPKTAALFEGNLARGGGITSATFIEKYIFNYPRPFIAAPERITRIPGTTYDSTPAYPSGHTNQATWKATLMATLVPETAPQLLARSSEVGYNRLAVGVHYPLDVIGGRMLGTAAAADRWSDLRFRNLLIQARDEVRKELEWRCGASISVCVAQDSPYLSTAEALSTYRERMTYGFNRIASTGAPLVVPASVVTLLGAFHPDLSSAQRTALPQQTALGSGYPLDDARPGYGSWQRLDIAAAVVPK